MTVKRIVELKDEMELILIKYGKLKSDRYERLFIRLDTLADNEIDRLYGELLNFRTNEYAELYRIFRLPLDNSNNGPEYWDRILRHDNSDIIFPEVKLLKHYSRICRDAWRELLIKTRSIRPKGRDVKIEESSNNNEKCAKFLVNVNLILKLVAH